MINYFWQTNDYMALAMIAGGVVAFIFQVYCVFFHKDTQ